MAAELKFDLKSAKLAFKVAKSSLTKATNETCREKNKEAVKSKRTSWAGSATLEAQDRFYFRTRKKFGKKLLGSNYARAKQNFWINKFWSKFFLGQTISKCQKFGQVSPG